jgi:two-component system phosphate regulon response regulator PhoB
VCPDPLEDWVWGSASPGDVDARVEALEHRHRARALPTLDESGDLRCHGVTVVLTPTEAVLVARLLADFGEVVGREALTRVAWPHGRVRARTLDTHMMRLRRRLAAAGLVVQTVRARGWLLEHVDAPADVPAPVPALG